MVAINFSMKPKYTKPKKYDATLVDRIAVAFLSSLIALMIGTVIWAFLAGLNLGGATFIVLPFSWVLWFTLVMAILGFLLLENFLASLFGYLWHGILFVFGIEPKQKL